MIDSCTTTNVVGVARSVVGVAPSVVGVAINGDVVANNVVEAATRNGEGGIALKERIGGKALMIVSLAFLFVVSELDRNDI